ncbi:hypothetical protein TVAG_275980 [Trichomonas vaginalis G3]|uniref:Cilia- and flagella-associated protein 206 n=1 Tax=Trichomonas vaginalis (strain ATCC PRA-98 / G3) TaxID=412133 RepID=A2EYH1_TRIV3|nr:hypothetical protein TVAGG3_0864330 [Trichomonas vaginalis G3]EAY02324.1 hypothetical protein TVAG_275980 [Trichomonas vaginalis G3]KAI5500905.1 hypothetical protein TVAGG3_0864330 [Trichomonas vaginalis G3]|eukprot:XP_001314639.1 hypothetical protein [Trichomonas vaginalis G3]
MEESIIHVVQTLADECLSKNIDASQALIAYTVRSVISSRLEEFQIDVSKPLEDSKVQLLHDESMKMLGDPESIPMLTIRMQVDMDLALAQADRNAKQKEERDKEHRDAIEQELITTRARSQTAIDALYRKIVSYTIITSHWGTPNDPQDVRLATSALEQIFPKSDVPKYLALSDEEKRAKLQDLSNNVLGVRVFQTFGGDLADPATNLRLEVPKKLNAAKDRITTSIEGVNSLIIEYNKALKDENVPNAKRLTDELANRQQFNFFYEFLLTRLKDISVGVEKSTIEFDSIIENLRNQMEISDSVPTQKSMPYFAALAEVWHKLKGCEDQVQTIENLLARLRKHRDTFTYSISTVDETAPTIPTPQQTPPTEKEVIPKESEVAGDDSHPVLVQHDADGEFAFNGFCPVTLVERNGLLLPGDVVLGSIKWEKRYYAFVDQVKRNKFLADPQYWHDEAMKVAQKKPELVPLLGLQNEFPILQAQKIPIRASQPKPKKSKLRDSEIQTEVHPVESYIDMTYHWNQWELNKRKKILKGLQNKRTKSSQTDESHYRRDSVVQTILKRDKGQQTMVETGTSMPRQVRYIAGLRGDSGTKPKVVTLTLDL